MAHALSASPIVQGVFKPTIKPAHALGNTSGHSVVSLGTSRAAETSATNGLRHHLLSVRSCDPSRTSVDADASDTEADEDSGLGTLTMEGRGKILVYRSCFKGGLRRTVKLVASGERRQAVTFSAGGAVSAYSPRVSVAKSAVSYTAGTIERARKSEATGSDVKVAGATKNVQKQQPYGVPDVHPPAHQQWDVVGLGQAMVDFSAMVGDDFLQQLALQKGTRKVIDHEERGQVLRALDGRSYKVSAGGSLSNTLVALARLGTAVPTASSPEPASAAAAASATAAKQQRLEEAASSKCSCSVGTSPDCEVHGEQALPGFHGGLPEVDPRERRLNVAMTGSVGSDALGDFYRTKLLRANVHFLSEPISEGTTGTVMVLTTPDAQRTMLAYMGMSSEVHADRTLEAAVSQSRVLVVEGYLWDLPKTVDAIESACKIAKARGTLVALTASDVFCVQRHLDRFWDVLANSADILFANVDEARALTCSSSFTSPADLARLLSRSCPLVSVTDGENGAYMAARGSKAVYIPPAPCIPVDSCGAGDAYAAGVLYGLLAGVPSLRSIGKFAADVAAVVVGQQGARLKEADATALVQAHEHSLQGWQSARLVGSASNASQREMSP